MTPETERTAPSAPGHAQRGHPPEDECAFISRVLRDERDAIGRIAERVGARYEQAVDLIVRCADSGGTVLVSGVGKSGHIGAKISATLASLGVPSHAVHPTEAAHGDLGRFRATDLAICLSHSGETEEVVNLAAILRQDKIPIIAITRGATDALGVSTLGRLASVVLEVGVVGEAGGVSVPAPTSSTTAALAIGDALALAAARRRSFTNDEFRARHPGGQLGSLLRPIMDLVRFRGENLPLASESMGIAEALTRASEVVRRPGALLVTDNKGVLVGIFTDSDLRRLVLEGGADLDGPIGRVMTRSPESLPETATASDAVTLFRRCRADEIPIVDASGRPTGLLDVQDLIAMRLVKDGPD